MFSFIFLARQSIRETWGNVTEFNHSQFAKIHRNMKGSYLNINYKRWHRFITNFNSTIQNEQHNGNISSEYNNSTAAKQFLLDQQNFAIKILFLVGQTLDNDTQNRIFNESELYGDMIQESFIDSYNNLTLKTIMMLKWVNDNCSHKGKKFDLLMVIRYHLRGIWREPTSSNGFGFKLVFYHLLLKRFLLRLLRVPLFPSTTF